MDNSNYPFVDFKIVQTYKALERAFQWKIDPIFRDVGPFTFVVEASETPDFSVINYTIAAGSNFYVIDATHLRQSDMVNFYYRAVLTTRSRHTYYSAAVIYFAKGEKKMLWQKAREIVRKEYVRYRFTGHKGWLLKRKNYGEQDATQLDPITGVPLTSTDTDIGTGYVGGYYSPLLVTYSREGVKRGAELNQEGFGVNVQETQQHRFIGFPLLEPYDVLVTDSNARYRYKDIDATFMPGTDIMLIQSCVALLLPPTDPIYSIKVP